SSAVPHTVTAGDERRDPRPVMIGGGAIAFGTSYAMAVVASVISSHQGDSHLTVPIVGPWLDLADRGGCGTAGVMRCDVEQGNKTGVVIDGIFQSVGLLTFVAG